MTPVEGVQCRLCGSDRAEVCCREAYRDRVHTLLSCRDCGLVYVHPLPPEDETGFDPLDPEEEDLVARSRRTAYYRKWLRRLSRRGGKGGRLLDVGCGTGHFLELAREEGFRTEGLEPAGRFREHCLSRGLEVAGGEIESCSLPGGSFDLITMWDSLEHCRDPKAALDRARDLLKDGGLILVKVPNIRSLNLAAARFLSRFRGEGMIRRDHPLQHLHFFSPRVLRRFFASSGWEVLATTTEPDAFSAWAPTAPRRAVKRILQAILKIFPAGLNDEIVLVARKPGSRR